MMMTMIYIGGMIPAYRNARQNGLGWFSTIMNVIVWPCEFGWYISDLVTKEIKE